MIFHSQVHFLIYNLTSFVTPDFASEGFQSVELHCCLFLPLLVFSSCIHGSSYYIFPNYSVFSLYLLIL